MIRVFHANIYTVIWKCSIIGKTAFWWWFQVLHIDRFKLNWLVENLSQWLVHSSPIRLIISTIPDGTATKKQRQCSYRSKSVLFIFSSLCNGIPSINRLRCWQITVRMRFVTLSLPKSNRSFSNRLSIYKCVCVKNIRVCFYCAQLKYDKKCAIKCVSIANWRSLFVTFLVQFMRHTDKV